MKEISQSMTPHEAAHAFYGLDEASFSDMIEKLSKSDPRLKDVFMRTRKRYLDANKS
ncbi:MAG: hypothetical protein ACSHW1_13840 [Yoonia sp.]|uniref:hypothetical protein n=1 Tax=Yoonia sp. TaxID=2212373 RepID=UPI003EF9DED0